MWKGTLTSLFRLPSRESHAESGNARAAKSLLPEEPTNLPQALPPPPRLPWIDWKSLKNKPKPLNNSNNQRPKEDKRKPNNNDLADDFSLFKPVSLLLFFYFTLMDKCDQFIKYGQMYSSTLYKKIHSDWVIHSKSDYLAYRKVWIWLKGEIMKQQQKIWITEWWHRFDFSQLNNRKIDFSFMIMPINIHRIDIRLWRIRHPRYRRFCNWSRQCRLQITWLGYRWYRLGWISCGGLGDIRIVLWLGGGCRVSAYRRDLHVAVGYRAHVDRVDAGIGVGWGGGYVGWGVGS